MERAPSCCHNGWRLVSGGSHFTHGAEATYLPTGGESLAVAWNLNHARMSVLDCEVLFSATEHRPLLGIFGNKE